MKLILRKLSWSQKLKILEPKLNVSREVWKCTNAKSILETRGKIKWACAVRRLDAITVGLGVPQENTRVLKESNNLARFTLEQANQGHLEKKQAEGLVNKQPEVSKKALQNLKSHEEKQVNHQKVRLNWQSLFNIFFIIFFNLLFRRGSRGLESSTEELLGETP